jgi:hypothetical protein
MTFVSVAGLIATAAFSHEMRREDEIEEISSDVEQVK